MKHSMAKATAQTLSFFENAVIKKFRAEAAKNRGNAEALSLDGEDINTNYTMLKNKLNKTLASVHQGVEFYEFTGLDDTKFLIRLTSIDAVCQAKGSGTVIKCNGEDYITTSKYETVLEIINYANTVTEVKSYKDGQEVGFL